MTIRGTGLLSVALWALVGCSRGVDQLDCPAGHSVEIAGGNRMCIDGEGRYDGPVTATVNDRGRSLKITGQFRGETPSGRWICEDTSTGERLAVTYDAARWSRGVYGVDLDEIRSPMNGTHLAVLPLVYCLPGQDWARIPKDGLAPDPHLGDLSKLGVTAELLGR